MRRRLTLSAKGLRLSIVAVLIPGLFGCGYRFAGESDFLPQDIRTIYVEPFIDRSREIGIATELTSALRSEFYRRGRLRLVDQPEQADAILTGVVRDFVANVASVNRKDEVLQYEAVLTLDATLRRREPSEVLWRTQGTRLTEIFAGSRAAVVTTSAEFHSGTLDALDVRRMTDIQLTETEIRAARDQLIERFAREVRQRMIELF
ncbi:MAG: LPS assembly lipoprotein LptE [Candidatus Binatia bacterium]